MLRCVAASSGPADRKGLRGARFLHDRSTSTALPFPTPSFFARKLSRRSCCACRTRSLSASSTLAGFQAFIVLSYHQGETAHDGLNRTINNGNSLLPWTRHATVVMFAAFATNLSVMVLSLFCDFRLKKKPTKLQRRLLVFFEWFLRVLFVSGNVSARPCHLSPPCALHIATSGSGPLAVPTVPTERPTLDRVVRHMSQHPTPPHPPPPPTPAAVV